MTTLTPSDVPRTVPQPDAEAAAAATARWATRAKPPGSLGRMEDLAVRVAATTGACPPAPIARPAVAVFAGDHGVVLDGASAWPQEITGFMVQTMCDRQAAINAFAGTVGATVRLVDVGVATDLTGLDGVVHAKVRPGTDSLAAGPAMTVDEAAAAIGVGLATATSLVDDGADCLVGGDMGIGNTTPSVALIAWATATEPAAITGPGAGLPADRLDHKAGLVAGALARVAEAHGPDADPLLVLAEVGGLEIAALAGLYLGAAARRVPFIVDGVIAASALCAADALAPGTARLAIAGHRSTEPAATVALAHLGLEPLLDLDLRLGEGTGACLAVPLVRAAVAALHDMADLPGT